MAKLTHAESRRLYSWWWDSHISPKNSKWLQENLTDMDIKVKAMIKLLEQDADSFARRAEMYYKKRPELMKLVEEFYRAYRALAERYDHATGALRQAHRTMAEAFPNQIPFVMSDESPTGSSKMSRPIRAMFDSDASPKDASHVPSQFHENGPYSEENEELTSKKGLKQLNDMFGSGEEVHSLKETISKLESEKEAALLQHRLSLERISDMETEISSCQEELKKLNDEILIVVSKLKSADERCLLLDKANQSLQLELDTFRQRAKEQREELNKKQEELERLNISIQDQQAEMAHMSQSQEEAKILALEVQRGIEKLKDMELSKLGLEEEIQKLTVENGRLNEQTIASAFKIINLQGEIIILKDSKAKLEDEVGLHVEEKKVLQQELTCLKEDKHDLEERHCWLTEKIEAVNINVESLQATVKELQERCKKHEDEKVVHLESLKHLEEISEKNVVLETSLLDANVEIEGSREKIKTLEESCGSLNDMVSIHRSEKVKLVSLVESIAREMEKLSERNTVLENSLSDVNVELKGLRVKSQVLEESCQSLYTQNSSLLCEKDSLVSQIERTIQSLENLETGYEELEVKHSNLEREKDLALRRIMELQDSFKWEKEEYETLITSIILSSKSREEELEVELHKIIDAQIENFILQRCLRDTNENSLILSAACWKHLEALECGEKLISELKHELLAREKKLTTSLVHNENLKEGIQLMLRELCVDKDCKSLDGNGIKDEILLQLTLREIRDLLNSISDAHDENHHLLLEKSVLITIIEQFGLNVMDLMMEKIALERESKTKIEVLSVLQSKELELLELNEQLRQDAQDAQASNQRKEALQGEICKLLEGNQSLSKKIYDSREKEDTLEEKNSVLLAEFMTVEYLYLIFRSSTTEKALELQLLRNELAFLHGKLAAVEAENVQLKEMVVNLEGCKEFEDELNTMRNVGKQLNLEIESGKDLLAQKDIELLQANHQLLSIQQENTEMCRNLEDLQLDLESLHKEVEDHKTKEEHLIYDLQKGEDEVKSCEVEIAALLNDVHITTVNAAVFEEKLFELLITCGICCMVQRETLHEEIIVRNVNVNELREKLASMDGENVGLKKELNAYLLLITALWDDIISLEEHTLLLANHRAANHSEKQENLSTHFQQSKSSQEPSENHSAALPAGLLQLQKLRAKVQALQKVAVDAESLVQQEMFESNTNFEASMNEIDAQTSKDIVMQLEKSEEPGTSLNLQKGDAGISEVKYEEMKDIQLDLVSSSPQYGIDVGSCGTSKIEKPGTSDQFFESWETTKRDLNNSSVHKIEYQINAVEEEKTEYPSCELVSEKEVSIDKLELPKKVTEYHQDLNSETIERLSTNAQRLSVLQSSVQELRRNMESSETSNGAASLEFDTVKAQLKEAEGAILQLIDTNRNLTEKAEEVSPSTDSAIVEQNGKRNKIIRQISERARRGSEKIGRLEFDLQKIKEDRVTTRVADEARRRVLLKDYLYGTADSRRQRRRRSFGCMRPRTKD